MDLGRRLWLKDVESWKPRAWCSLGGGRPPRGGGHNRGRVPEEARLRSHPGIFLFFLDGR